MLDPKLLDRPNALINFFTELFLQTCTSTGDQDEGNVDESELSAWQPVRVSVSPRRDLVAVLSQARTFDSQRVDLYDLNEGQLIRMNQSSLVDALPVFDLQLQRESGRIHFIFDEFEEEPDVAKPSFLSKLFKPTTAKKSARKYWAGGYSLMRREWILPSPAELDETPPRTASEEALVRAPKQANLATRPLILGGPYTDFGVYHHIEVDEDSGDFLATIVFHGLPNQYHVARLDGRSGALKWHQPLSEEAGYQCVGEWIVTDSGVLRIADGTFLCSFGSSVSLYPDSRCAVAARDASLWVCIDREKAPGSFLRVSTDSGATQTLKLQYLRLLGSSGYWLGFTYDADGGSWLHGLPEPDASGFSAPLWSIQTDIPETISADFHLIGDTFFTLFEGITCWSLDLRNGAVFKKQFTEGEWLDFHCIQGDRAYFSVKVDYDQWGLYWLEPATQMTGEVPLPKGKWEALRLEDDLIYAIENRGNSFVSRHVPSIYTRDTGVLLWEGVHTRLCKTLLPTRNGLAVGIFGEIYLFPKLSQQ